MDKRTVSLMICFFALFFFLYGSSVHTANATMTCSCKGYEYYSCPGNSGCKIAYDKNGRAINKCGYATCIRCYKTECHDDNPPCHPVSLFCSSACGQSYRCAGDNCGGSSCCPATAPCPTATPTPVPCRLACQTGSYCYQPPMPACPVGMVCPQVMPAQICATVIPTPDPCPRRSQGDANCDSLVNDTDYDILRSAMKGLQYTSANYSADFNKDNKVNLVDYEIWRNTFLK